MMKKAICFGCDAVQQIDAKLSSARCACGGNILPLVDLNAFRIARLAHRLAGGYYVHSAILDLVPSDDGNQPIDYTIVRGVHRKDGTKHQHAFNHYLREAVANTKTKEDLDRVWLTGALISIGDALDKNVKNISTELPILNLCDIYVTGSPTATAFGLTILVTWKSTLQTISMLQLDRLRVLHLRSPMPLTVNPLCSCQQWSKQRNKRIGRLNR